MRVDELKPGTGVHCKTEGDALRLFREFRRLGYKWRNGETVLDTDADILFDNIHDGGSVYYIESGLYGGKGSITRGSYWHYMKHIEDYLDIDKILEFSELDLCGGEEFETDEPFSLDELVGGE